MKDRQSLLAEFETLLPLALELRRESSVIPHGALSPVTFSITTTKRSSSCNYEGKIFECPEIGGDESVQFAPQREWSRWESSDIDGQAVRPNERERVSQYHDEYLYSWSRQILLLIVLVIVIEANQTSRSTMPISASVALQGRYGTVNVKSFPSPPS
jgi:hypothetical protein